MRVQTNVKDAIKMRVKNDSDANDRVLSNDKTLFVFEYFVGHVSQLIL